MNGALLRNSILDAIDSLPNLANNLKDYPWLKSNFEKVAASVAEFLVISKDSSILG